MVYLRLWGWVSYYDDTRVRIEEEITRRVQIEAEKDVRLAELDLHKTQIIAHRDVLLGILNAYLADRSKFFDQRQLYLTKMLEQRDSSITTFNRIVANAAQNNNIELFDHASKRIIELQSIDPIKSLKELEATSSSEALKLLGSGVSKLLSSS